VPKGQTKAEVAKRPNTLFARSMRLCAVLIDGTPFKDRQMIAALGIGCDGTETVLRIREGATPNRVSGVNLVGHAPVLLRLTFSPNSPTEPRQILAWQSKL
jgi:hypothetical protein